MTYEGGVAHGNGEQGTGPGRQRSPTASGQQDKGNRGGGRHGRVPRGQSVGVVPALGDVEVGAPQDLILEDLTGQVGPHHRHHGPDGPAVAASQQADDQDRHDEDDGRRHRDHRQQGAGVVAHVVRADLRALQGHGVEGLTDVGAHEQSPQADRCRQTGQRQQASTQTQLSQRTGGPRLEGGHWQIVGS